MHDKLACVSASVETDCHQTSHFGLHYSIWNSNRYLRQEVRTFLSPQGRTQATFSPSVSLVYLS